MNSGFNGKMSREDRLNRILTGKPIDDALSPRRAATFRGSGGGAATHSGGSHRTAAPHEISDKAAYLIAMALKTLLRS